MPSGRQAYSDLNRQVDALRKQSADLSRRLSDLSTREEQVQAEENRETARLAQLRLGSIEARQVGSTLGAAEREAMVQMAHKEVAEQRCQADIEASEARQSELEQRRRQASDDRDELAQRFDQRYIEVADGARATPEWQALNDRADRLAGQAELAQEKAQLAQADRVEKGAPYEADRLFMYLWQRQYGSAGYRANPLIRTLDGWVARKVGWMEAVRNYRLLTALPDHLQRHADALRSQADTALAEQQAMEQKALADSGMLAMNQELLAAEARVDELSAQIADEEKRHASLLQRRSELAEGGDEYTRRALSVLSAAIASEPASSLQRAAARTAGNEDDTAAAAIDRLRQSRQALAGESARVKQEHDQALASLKRVEELRRRFRDRQYDAGDSDIDDGVNWGGLLGGVLRGVMEMGRAWEQIERNQRFRLPKGVRLPKNLPGGIFGGGGSSGGSRGGGFGGGIFKGGGGFGGGGFKSGGGF